MPIRLTLWQGMTLFSRASICCHQQCHRLSVFINNTYTHSFLQSAVISAAVIQSDNLNSCSCSFVAMLSSFCFSTFYTIRYRPQFLTFSLSHFSRPVSVSDSLFKSAPSKGTNANTRHHPQNWHHLFSRFHFCLPLFLFLFCAFLTCNSFIFIFTLISIHFRVWRLCTLCVVSWRLWGTHYPLSHVI